MKGILLAALLLINSATILLAQRTSDKSTMEAERRQLQQELQQIQESYNAVRGITKDNMAQLAALSKKVELQEKYISNISKEIGLINDDIYYSQLEINQLKKQLDTLKVHYARTVVYTYKNRSNYDYLNFIFSANSFNDAVKRVAYLKSYRNYRQQQMTDIYKTSNLIASRQNLQITSKQKKSDALVSRSAEYNVLENQKTEKDSVVKLLQSQAGDLQKQISKKQQRDQQLKANIAAVVRREIADARKIAMEDAKRRADAERKARADALARQQAIDEQNRLAALAAAKAKEVVTAAPPAKEPAPVPKTIIPAERVAVEASVKTRRVPDAGKNIDLNAKTVPLPARPANINVATVTPAPPAVTENKAPVGGYLNFKASDISLNSNFEQNRGRLPYPVDNGTITLGFGRYKIEGVGPDIVGDNPGITFTTPVGTAVRTVFDGEVASVSNIGGMHLVVLRHGKYFTAYSNLASVSVGKGTKVARGQQIGTVGADEDTGNGKLDFILMIEERNVNPRIWLHP